MKNLYLLMAILFCFHITNSFSQTRKEEKKLNPPEVIISSTYFDSNGNKSLDPGERSRIELNLKNNGKSTANGLRVFLQPLDNSISLNNYSFISGDLEPGSEKIIEFFVIGASDLDAGISSITVTVTEDDGFYPAPAEIKVIRMMSSPLLTISDYKFTSAAGGKIALGNTVDLNIVVQNNGAGNAENVVVTFKNPENVFPAGNTSFSYPTIAPGEKKMITYTFLPNSKFSGKDIAITADAVEKNGKFGASSVMKVNLEQEIAGTVSNEAGKESDMIYRGGGDPLKGLGVADEKKEMQLGDYYALIIGVDKYIGAWTPLNNAVKDAKAIENTLRTQYKFNHFRTLYDAQATRKEILKEMEWLVANVKETDNVFIYYSGHGEFKKELNKGYWVPVDAATTSTADFISNNDIQTLLSGIKSKHTLLVSDACFSGDLFRGKTITVPFENSTKYYSKIHNLNSRKAISSGGIEPVMDGGRDGHSVFAYYFLKALETNKDHFYDASQLYESLRIPVVNNSEQTPNFQPIKNTGDEGGQFIFIRK